MKILLHVCCAPCLIYPLDELNKKGFQVAAIFYNPNIHPLSEYRRRKEAVDSFLKNTKQKFEFLCPDYEPADFFRKINLNESKDKRCQICWGLRLSETARSARKKGFDYFTTTLLVSPYQDQELLKNIGKDVSLAEGVKFYGQDFRPGFKEAHQKAKDQGLYCQNYCGCIYSEIERFKAKKKKQ